MLNENGRALYTTLVNPRMAEAVSAMGFDKNFTRGRAQYLYDAGGQRYLDFVSGYGACFVGRNHPKVAAALHDAIESELPNLVQMDTCAAAGLLAKALLEVAPRSVEMAYFASSGAEAVETALKLARKHTGKRRIVYLDNAFHGMTLGALSVNGTAEFREGFGPLLPGWGQASEVVWARPGRATSIAAIPSAASVTWRPVSCSPVGAGFHPTGYRKTARI